jgi:hypothetical protein
LGGLGILNCLSDEDIFPLHLVLGLLFPLKATNETALANNLQTAALTFLAWSKESTAPYLSYTTKSQESWKLYSSEKGPYAAHFNFQFHSLKLVP